MAVAERSHVHIALWPNDPDVEGHPNIRDSGPEARQWTGSKLLSQTVSREAAFADSELAAAPVPGLLGARSQLEPSLDARLDRVDGQDLDVFEATSTKVCFDYSGCAGHVVLLGTDYLPTPDAIAAPAASWSQWVWGAVASVVLLAALVALCFGARGAFYASDPGCVWCLYAGVPATLGAALLVGGRRRRTTARGKRRPGGRAERAGLALLVASTLAVVAIFLIREPSATVAMAALAGGDLTEAERHFAALDQARPADEDVSNLRAELELARVRALDNRAATRALSAAIDRFPASSERLREERRALRSAWVRQALSAGQRGEALLEARRAVAESPGDRSASFLVANIRAQVSQEARSASESGDPGRAVAILEESLPSDMTTNEERSLLVDAHRLRLAGCSNLECRARSYYRLAQLEAAPDSANRLAAFKTTTLARVDRVQASFGRVAKTIADLQQSQQDCGDLHRGLGGDAEVAAACVRVAERLAAFR